MPQLPTELKDEDLLFAYLPEYLDGELPAALAARYEKLLQTPPYQALPAEFQALRGRLQLALQSYYLKESELAELGALVQDPRLKANAENTKIEQLGRGVMVNTMMRRGALTLVAAALVFAGYWRFGHTHEQKFRPLEYLGYEAIALEEDAQERLNLPSHDLKEVHQYLTTYPGLDFKPKMLHDVPSSWEVDGATVIDYEIAKVAAVMYENHASRAHEKLFYFTFAGDLGELPQAEPGNMRGLIFQTYTTDELNLIAWQSSTGVVSLLVGRRSAPELAEIAVAGVED